MRMRARVPAFEKPNPSRRESIGGNLLGETTPRVVFLSLDIRCSIRLKA